MPAPTVPHRAVEPAKITPTPPAPAQRILAAGICFMCPGGNPTDRREFSRISSAAIRDARRALPAYIENQPKSAHLSPRRGVFDFSIFNYVVLTTEFSANSPNSPSRRARQHRNLKFRCFNNVNNLQNANAPICPAVQLQTEARTRRHAESRPIPLWSVSPAFTPTQVRFSSRRQTAHLRTAYRSNRALRLRRCAPRRRAGTNHTQHRNCAHARPFRNTFRRSGKRKVPDRSRHDSVPY